MGPDRRLGERGDAGFERREKLVHRVTDADGPGSPGGLAKPGRAEGLGGWDPGMRLRPRGGDEAPRRDEPGPGVAEAMAEGRFGQQERPPVNRAGEPGASRAVPATGRRAGEPEERA